MSKSASKLDFISSDVRAFTHPTTPTVSGVQAVVILTDTANHRQIHSILGLPPVESSEKN